MNENASSTAPGRVDREGSHIYITGAPRNPSAWNYLEQAIVGCIEDNHPKITIHSQLEPLAHPWPDFEVPLAVVLSKAEELGLQIEFDINEREQSSGSLWNPDVFVSEYKEAGRKAFSKVWKFDEDNVHDLQNHVAQEALAQVEWASGTHNYFVTVAYELMDNILEHSDERYGFIAININPINKYVNVCVGDGGVGIAYNLQQSDKIKYRNSRDALLASIELGVTSKDISDPSVAHRGRGLWMTARAAELGSGVFDLQSGSAALSFRNPDSAPRMKTLRRHRVRGGDKKDMRFPPATLVHFGTVFDRPIDQPQMAGREGGFVNEYLEGLTSDDRNSIRIKDHARGTGTRRAAEALRNVILSLYNTESEDITLDFTGVEFCSHSFLDEFIGGIIDQVGIGAYVTEFSIVNARPHIRNIIKDVITVHTQN